MTVDPHTSELPDIQTLWDYDEPAATAARLRAVLPAAEAAGRPSYHAELLTQIARTQSLRRDFDAAHATLDAADAMITEDMPRARVRSLLERGRTLNSAGRSGQARPLFAEAWEVARASTFDGLAVDAAHMMAIVAPPEEALVWNERALEVAMSSADPDARRWTGSLHNNIGWTRHGGGAYDEALVSFEAALAARRIQGKPDDVRVARWCVARCLRSLGRVDEALTIQREIEAEWAAAEKPDGYVFEEIAECLLALGDDAAARPWFGRAHALLSQDAWLTESEPERIARLGRLGGH